MADQTDWFNFDDDMKEPEPISKDEYIAQTRAIMSRIEHAYLQCWYKLPEDQLEICDHCNGIGWLNGDVECGYCHGTGSEHGNQFDAEHFQQELEDVMFNTNFLQLLNIPIKDGTNIVPIVQQLKIVNNIQL